MAPRFDFERNSRNDSGELWRCPGASRERNRIASASASFEQAADDAGSSRSISRVCDKFSALKLYVYLDASTTTGISCQAARLSGDRMICVERRPDSRCSLARARNRHYRDARKAFPFASCKKAILALSRSLFRLSLAHSARGFVLAAKAARPSAIASS